MKKQSAGVVLYNSSIYTITSILQKAVQFLLLPIYTLYLTPTDYGITGIVNSFVVVLSLFFTMALTGAVQRFYYVYKDEPKKLQGFYSTIILFVLFNSLILGSLVILFKDFLVEPFIDGIDFYPYLLIGILTVMVNPIYNIYQSLLQTMQKAKSFAINSSLNFILLVSLNIFFIVALDLGAAGQLLATFITALVFALYSFYSLYKLQIITLTFNFDYLKEALSYSLPLLPHLLSTNIASLVSRLFLNNQVSTASAGLFNIANQFMIIIDTIQVSVNNAYVPWFYNMMGQGKDAKEEIINFADFICRIYLIISLAFGLFIKEIIQVFTTEQYLQAWVIIPIMLVAYQIRAIYYFYVNTLFYNRKATRYIFIATVSGSLLSVFLTAFLTSYFGYYTPAIVLLIQQIFTTVIVYIMSRRIEPVDFKIKNMIIYVLLLALLLFLGLWKDIQNPFGQITLNNLLWKSIILLLSVLVIFYKDREFIINKSISLFRMLKRKYKK